MADAERVNGELEMTASPTQGIALRAKNYRTMDLAYILLIVVLGAFLWQHMQEAKAGQLAVIASNEKVAQAIRFYTCIQIVPLNDRMQEFKDRNGLCAKVSERW